MKKTIIGLLLLGFLYNFSNAQTAEQVRHYFETKSWDSVITCGKAVIDIHKDEYDTYMLVGRAYNSKYMFTEAILYLEKAKSLKQVPGWVTAWSMCELGFSYYVTHNQKLAAENLTDCIKLNATPNSTKTALKHYWIFGLDPYYANWSVEKSEHFNFYFQDSSFQRESFIKSHEEAFDSLTKLFNCKIPHHIDFYVWTNDTDQLATKMMGPLAFSRPQFGITHTSISHSLAHEMMHHILSYSFPGAKRNVLISEGTCVYFDMSGWDNMKKLKSINRTSEINVRECWKHSDRLSDDIIYPLGGELVKRIFEKFGKEKFFAFMADQSLENANRVFGKELDALIAQLESDIKRK